MVTKTKKNVVAKKDAPTREAVHIAALKRSGLQLLIMGDTPLIVHAWDVKARLEMLQRHMQLPTIREAKNPYELFLRCIYRMDDGAYGFPVVGIKESMATSAVDIEGVAKAQIYRNIAVTGRRGLQYAAFADLKTPIELAELFSPVAPYMREDMVRLSGISRTPDVRYRAEFWPWAMRFTIGYLSDFINYQSILNLVMHGGARIGLGEWRQERGGNNGGFHVASDTEVKQIERWIKAGQVEPEPIDVAAWIASIQPKEEPQKQINPELVNQAAAKKRRAGNGKSNVVLGRYEQ